MASLAPTRVRVIDGSSGIADTIGHRIRTGALAGDMATAVRYLMIMSFAAGSVECVDGGGGIA